MDKLLTLLATGFGFGRAPFAPGTFGTLWGIPLVFLFYWFGPYFYLLSVFIFIALAVYVAEWYEHRFDGHDRKEVVIDEMAGYVIAMTWLPLNWKTLVAAFIIFRLFDALKPFPISYIDRKIPGGFGVVLDDVAAGLVSSLILQVILSNTNWLY